MATVSRPVTWAIDNGIATVRLEREHGNAINGELADGVLTALQEVRESAEARAVLLAAGGKLFCPGLDLQELLPLDRPAMHRFLERFNACVLGLYTFPKPLIAAISGHALAGGCVFAATADWRIAKEGALLGLNELKVGVPFPYGVAQILSAAVPANRLHEVTLLGRNYTGPEAITAGLVDEIASSEDFDTTCRARVEEFASKDAQAFTITKRYLRAEVVERIRSRGPMLDAEFLDAWFSPSTRARVEQVVAELKSKSRG